MLLVKNRRAHFDYEIKKTLTAGIVLEGREVKSLRLKHASLTGSFIKIIGNEIYLLNVQINPYAFAQNEKYDPKRTRKLLLSRKEITDLSQATQNKGWVLVPIEIKTVGRQIKVEIGLGRGKKQYEKKEKIKQRDLDRETKRTAKNY